MVNLTSSQSGDSQKNRIKRERYMEMVRGFIDQTEVVKVITGIRRCGKSVMFTLIQEELIDMGVRSANILTYNFEDMTLRQLKDSAVLHDHLKARLDLLQGRAYLFLDEIQEVENWELTINSLRVNSDVDIYITGSNAKMLSGEYATALAGRYIEVRMYPFSFSEFHMALRMRRPAVTTSESFQQYLTSGGMPFLFALQFDADMAKQYLNDIFTSVVIKDIIKRGALRNVDLLERIIAYVMANIGRAFSATSISKYFKNEKRIIAPETILNYLKGCEDALLFSRVGFVDLIGKKILQVNEKYYMADHGIREAIYGNNERDIELILENIVCIELLRRGYKVMVGRVGAREIDFICDKSGERIYVQVCYLLATEETIAREFDVLRDIPDNFPKYVVSMDEVNMSRDGVLHKHIRDFLLQPQYAPAH